GEGLRGFQPRRRRRGSEDRHACRPQRIGDAGRQRRLGPDEDEIDRVLLGEGHDRRAVENVEVGAFGDHGDAGIARRHDEPAAFGVLLHRPGERVFAAPAAENENVHGAPAWPRVPRVLRSAESRDKDAMDIFEDDEGAGQGGNAPEFTVSELSGAIRRVIEGEFGHVRVRGEIGRVARPASGHLYFDLKDDRAVIAAIAWKGQAARLSVKPEEGMEVVATGRLTTFPGQSKYQLIVEDIAPAGLGALMLMLEKRKAMLAAEGLFAEARKRPIPFLPEVIGVVTSPSGAVIRDILHRLRDRFPRRVLIWPVAVQGEKCAPEVAAAIRGFNALPAGGTIPRPDLIIVARGGGSIEDLWGFNEETVVRAVAASAIPLISAVGHETDTTLIDHAADRRAPTPTAAAEMAVPVRLELLAWAADAGARLARATGQGLDRRRQRLADLARALGRPETLLDPARQRLDLWSDRLAPGLSAAITRKRAAFNMFSGKVHAGLLAGRIAAERRHVTGLSDRLGPGLSAAI